MQTRNITFGAVLPNAQVEKFMTEAEKLASKSKCQRAKTGAVITDKSGKMLAKGHNTVPDIFEECTKPGKCPRENLNVPSGFFYTETCPSICAEQITISNVKNKDSMKDGTLLLFGHYHLCKKCSILTYLKGITDIYVKHTPQSEIKHIPVKQLMEDTKIKSQEALEGLKPILPLIKINMPTKKN